jgi:hypothetical protein
MHFAAHTYRPHARHSKTLVVYIVIQCIWSLLLTEQINRWLIINFIIGKVYYSPTNAQVKGKVQPCTGTEALYRSYGLYRASVPIQWLHFTPPLLPLRNKQCSKIELPLLLNFGHKDEHHLDISTCWSCIWYAKRHFESILTLFCL